MKAKDKPMGEKMETDEYAGEELRKYSEEENRERERRIKSWSGGK